MQGVSPPLLGSKHVHNADVKTTLTVVINDGDVPDFVASANNRTPYGSLPQRQKCGAGFILHVFEGPGYGLHVFIFTCSPATGPSSTWK